LSETRAKSRDELVSKVLCATLLGYQIIANSSSDKVGAVITFVVLLSEIHDILSLVREKLKSR